MGPLQAERAAAALSGRLPGQAGVRIPRPYDLPRRARADGGVVRSSARAGPGSSGDLLPRLLVYRELERRDSRLCRRVIFLLELLGRDAPYAARAVGTASWVVRRLTTRDLAWADVVLNAVPMFLEEGEEVRLEAHGRYKPLSRAAVPRSSPGRCIASP